MGARRHSRRQQRHHQTTAPVMACAASRRCTGCWFDATRRSATLAACRLPAGALHPLREYARDPVAVSAGAARALAWAQRNGIGVPDDLAAIASNRDARYYHLGLSYCGPDWDTVGYQMAHAAIGDVPVARTSKGFISAAGTVVAKMTTPRDAR